MKILKWIGIVVVSLAILFVGVAFLLPSQAHCERSLVIDAPPEVIYPLLNDLEQWQEWTPWNADRDPSLKLEYSDDPVGKDAWYSWKGDELGNGKLQISSTDPASGVEYDLAFNDGAQLSTGGLKMVPAEGGTKVTWSFVGEMGNNPIGRYFGLMMDGMLGPDFEKGLGSLKEVAESRAKETPAEPAEENPDEDES